MTYHYDFMGNAMDLLTTSEMAELWNISRRRVTTLCKDGRIKGAILKGNTWLIPKGTSKPEDPRHRYSNTKTREEISNIIEDNTVGKRKV